MKQIEADISIAGNIANDIELMYYENIDTMPSLPHIYEGMSPEAESAAWERYRQNLRESQNRKENYNKLRNFCDGMVRDTRNRLEEIYDRLEELYKKHVVEFENTDDDYKREAEEVYDACTDDKERIWDAVVKTAEFLNDIEEGAEAAVVDFISGILGLAVMLARIDLALRVAAVTVPFGTTTQWVKDTGKEAVEGVLGIVQIIKNPGRALAAIGQKATDVVEEKGIPYALSYTVTDIAIGRLVDMGLGKLKSLAMGDELADAARALDKVDDVADTVKVMDNLGDAAKVVERIDDTTDAVKIANELGGVENAAKVIDKLEGMTDAAKIADGLEGAADSTKTVTKIKDGVGGIEGGGSSLIDIDKIRPQLKTDPDTAFFWSGRTEGIGGADIAADIAKGRGGVTLESTIDAKKIVMPEWDFNNPSTMEAWDLASEAYAEQVSGEIRAVVGSELRSGSIWENIELPRLKANPDVTKITIIDPKTQVETIIFKR